MYVIDNILDRTVFRVWPLVTVKSNVQISRVFEKKQAGELTIDPQNRGLLMLTQHSNGTTTQYHKTTCFSGRRIPTRQLISVQIQVRQQLKLANLGGDVSYTSGVGMVNQEWSKLCVKIWESNTPT